MRIYEQVKISRENNRIKIEGKTIKGSVIVTDAELAFLYAGGTGTATVNVEVGNETKKNQPDGH